MTDKDTVLREADFVCINTPLTPETRRMVGDREFSLMKPTACFINTARGPIVDETALSTALVERRIAGAALDVFEQEPVALDNPLLKLENVIVTPHSICWTMSSSATTRKAHSGRSSPWRSVRRRPTSSIATC